MSSSSSEDENDISYVPRSWMEEDQVVKRVRKLPIKKETGSVIPQDEKLDKPILATKKPKVQAVAVEKEEEEEEEYSEQEEEEAEPEALSTREKRAGEPEEEKHRDADMSIEDQLVAIARFSTSILADEPNSLTTEGVRTNAKGEAVAPEKTAMDRLMRFAKSPTSVWTVRKAAWLSLLAVFKGMLPYEFVRELTEKELQSKATKDTRLQRAQEKVIMTAYKYYVAMLLEERNNSVATYCLCHLLEARGTQFNMAEGILAHMLQRGTKVCLDSLGRILEDDPSFESTLCILKRVGRIYEKKSSRGVNANVLQLFLKLRLNLDLKDEKRMQEIEKAKKHRKDKKRRLGADLTKLLEETDATSTRNHEMHQRQMEIIRELFTLYLRILTTRSPSNPRRAALTIQALRGARKLVQLVNIEFIHAIVRLLSTFNFDDEENEFHVGVALETCETGLTALAVLARPELRAAKVECEEDFFTELLSRCLVRVQTPEDFKLVHQCAQLLFFRRREGDPRVVADFCKILVSLSLRLADMGVVLGLVTLQRMLVDRYSGVKDLLMGSKTREEESCGPLIPIGATSEANTASSKKVWELDLLAVSHFDVSVRKSAAEGREFKPLLTNNKPVELMQEHDSVNGVLFHPFVLPQLNQKLKQKQRYAAAAEAFGETERTPNRSNNKKQKVRKRN